MSWIKIQTNLREIPEVGAIAARLRMAEAHVVGCLVSVWSWADSLTADGFVQYATGAQIDKKAGKKGFAEAMTCVGWLRLEASGVTFPKWYRHNGESAKARAGEAEAKRLSRAGNRRSGPATVSAQNEPNLSGQMSAQNGDKCPDQRRGEEIREEKNKTVEKGSPPPAGGLSADADLLPVSPRLNEFQATSPQPPFPLDTPEFTAAWADWLAYRRERKLAVWKPRTVAAKMAEMAAWGHDQAIDSIRQSIANGWQGIFEPKQGGGFQQKTKARALSTDLSHEQLTKIHKGTF